MSIIEQKNATQIFKNLINNSSIHMTDEQTIRNILIKLRQTIAHFLKDKYELEALADENQNKKIAVDESCFTHYNNKQVWIIGLINTQTKEFRLIPSYTRNTPKIKEIIQRHAKRGNTIISDDWPGYWWLNEPNSGYMHITHVHSHANFGYGDESTSHIEQLWSVLKTLFRRIYVTVPSENFNIFLREIEFRYLITNKNDNDKLKELLEIFDYVNSTINFNLYDLDSLNLI